jgi:acyl-CoA thioester hydrolase
MAPTSLERDAKNQSSISSPFFSTTIALRWRDMDSYQHVNNSEYLTLCEEARIGWFHTLAGPWRSQSAEPVLARVEMDYIVPLVYPAAVRVQLYLARVGNSSLTLINTLECGDTLYASGKTVLVWIDPRTGRSTPLPEFVRAQFVCFSKQGNSKVVGAAHLFDSANERTENISPEENARA